MATDINWSELSAAEEEELTNPDASVVAAIATRDAVLLQRALDAGGSAKQKVGKEKMSLFAMKNFDKDVMQVLVKAGMSFKDLSNLHDVVIAMDNGDALEWLSKTKPWLQLMESKSHAHGLIVSGVQHGAVNCLKLLSNIGLFHKTTDVNQHQTQGGFWAALQTKSTEQVVEFTLFPALQKHIGSSIYKGMSQGLYGTTLTLGQLQRLQQVLQDSRLEAHTNKLFPLAIKGYGHIRADRYKNFSKDTGVVLPGKHTYSIDLPTVQAQNFTQWVVLTGSSACQALAMHPDGKNVVAHTLSSQDNLVHFVASATKETLSKVLKRVPELHAWRDDHGNSVFHYAMYLQEASATFAQEVFSANKVVSVEPNELGNTPMKYVGREAMSKIEKSLMKTAVKDIVKTKSKSVSRKM